MRYRYLVPFLLCALNLNISARTGEVQTDEVLSKASTWSLNDPQTDSVQGVASKRALKEYPLPINKPEIIVAVIDSGVDVNHKHLQNNIWINKAEIPNNGVDDDENGYIDDINGWNFLGHKDGMAKFIRKGEHYKLIQAQMSYQVGAISYALTREFMRLKIKSELTEKESIAFKEISSQIKKKKETATKRLLVVQKDLQVFLSAKSILGLAGLQEFTVPELVKFQTQNMEQQNAKTTLLDLFSFGYTNAAKFEDEIQGFKKTLNVHLNTIQDIRNLIVQDDLDNDYQRHYGNNDVIGTNPKHGTHVAGIIAAEYNEFNNQEGIAPHAKIMVLRAVTSGDEYDKDVANSIYYAVDNGAHIINMSFGKYYSDNAPLIADAVSYAEKNNVLIVHSAGNDYLNLDENNHYPIREINGQMAKNYLVIGASSKEDNSSLVARFSNFGKRSVDFFAPGVSILSTTPGNEYQSLSGTSMAAPVTSAVAALLLSYDSTLTPSNIINLMTSSLDTYEDLMISKPMIGSVEFSELSIFAGKLNAYKSIKKLHETRL